MEDVHPLSTMGRRARLKLAGQPWHVIQRGVNRSRCFMRDGDRRLYMSLLDEHAAAQGCAVHAYVLMSNHVHLLLTPGDDWAVSRMMKAIGERYVRYFNKTHHRTGTLWEGRFRSSIIDSQSYLFTCQRYIELNPVRAGLASHPSEYAWSSYLANAEGAKSAIVTPHPLFLSMSPDAEERRRAYRALFERELSADELYDIREAVIGGFALGGPIHIWAVQSNTGMRAYRLNHWLEAAR
jgi:putative transposase